MWRDAGRLIPKHDWRRDWVVFRKWPQNKGGGVIALFPLEPKMEPGTCNSFGYGSSPSWYLGRGAVSFKDVIRNTTPATWDDDEQMRDLYHLFLNAGRGLTIRKRLPSRQMIAEYRRKAGWECRENSL